MSDETGQCNFNCVNEAAPEFGKCQKSENNAGCCNGCSGNTDDEEEATTTTLVAHLTRDDFA